MKVLVTGASGQLGRRVVSLLQKRNYETIACGKHELDITNESSVHSIVASTRPDAVFHCAAYTNVEAAEDVAKELNWQVNLEASANMAKAVASVGTKLIYISTDYVFDGTKSEPYEVDDPTNPLNEYGAAKLAGEQEVLRYVPYAHVIRTSWVFEEYGHNFVNTMLRLAQTMDIVKVVNDQHGRPTYAPDLAEFMLYILEAGIPGGIYHFANEGETTWYEFAKAILRRRDVTCIPVNSSEFVQKAKRPKHSVLSLASVKQTGFAIRTWHDALERFEWNKLGEHTSD